jgi:predicted RNase H-like nuclease
VRYLGVDLAWGERARTGLAVLDSGGRLVHAATVKSDEEIVSFANTHAAGSGVAAIDAPLIVPNETGRRVAERLVAERFARFGAGPYPANRGNPLFWPVPRGARIAARLGWELDPSVRPGPGHWTTIEVFPHPACIALFGLSHILPYKNRHGRSVAVRTAAFAQLLGHIEEFLGRTLRPGGCARWREIRHAAAAAMRQADLERIEDEVDAVICAYLAWLWHRHPASCWVLGDGRGGYIVTPRLADHRAGAGGSVQPRAAGSPDRPGRVGPG